LAACGRAHTVDDIARSLDYVQQAGITNYSLDLIAGLPHQTIDQWQDSLQQAIAYAPTHIATYDLTIESGTVFGKRYRPGDRPLPSDASTAEMYRMANRLLGAAGYAHYEVSNYAQPGYQCQHNRTYWANRSFYGFGMGATSYLRGDRLARPRQLQAYQDWVTTFDPDPDPIDLAPNELLLDTLMVGFRLAEGLAVQSLRKQFGDRLIQQVGKCLERYRPSGWIEAIGHDGTVQTPIDNWLELDRIRLTAPEGFLFSNVVLVELFDRLGT
jgi:coproporphyrinogen III oxidase-like Fe-S oxidoreductase